ncbi:MAG TPA: NINE protein [Corynebacterium sp.]|nr:NINE protein [Corynebacterium sp.]
MTYPSSMPDESQPPYSGGPYPGGQYNQTYGQPHQGQNFAPYQQANQYGAPQAYGMAGQYGAPVEQKSRALALILCFLLGSLGIHNFYYGQTGAGVAKLVLSILGWLTAIIFIGVLFLAIVSIWVFIDLILIALGAGYMATDRQGVPTRW